MVQLVMILLLGLTLCNAARLPDNAALHFQLYRRGGRLSRHEPANLTRISQLIEQSQQKYLRTYREVAGNRLVRQWAPEFDELHMLDEAGLDDRWYFNLDVGDPVQTIEADLDMLSPDFYTIMTSSGQGSKYDSFKAQSHNPGTDYVHPYCRLAKDRLTITPFEAVEFSWPICQASHSSQHTLRKSGTVFGLSMQRGQALNALSRLSNQNFLSELHEAGVIPSQVWSITVLDATSGILSLGGTMAKEMETIKSSIELELNYLGQEDAEEKVRNDLQGRLISLGSTVEEQFKWLNVHGANGWWTGLVSGIWVNGVKVLKNQPFLLDVNCPWILAPPQAFSHFHESISGFRLLDAPHDQFAVFPCLNPPQIAFEMAGWQFPVPAHGTREDVIHGPAGGRFSLGKLDDMAGAGKSQNGTELNSGFCVTSVVKSTMSEREAWRNSGMKNAWVLGEPFFRGLGIVFESGKEPRIGLRSY